MSFDEYRSMREYQDAALRGMSNSSVTVATSIQAQNVAMATCEFRWAEMANANGEHVETIWTEPPTAAVKDKGSFRGSRYASPAPAPKHFEPDHSVFRPDETAHLFKRSL